MNIFWPFLPNAVLDCEERVSPYTIHTPQYHHTPKTSLELFFFSFFVHQVPRQKGVPLLDIAASPRNDEEQHAFFNDSEPQGFEHGKQRWQHGKHTSVALIKKNCITLQWERGHWSSVFHNRHTYKKRELIIVQAERTLPLNLTQVIGSTRRSWWDLWSNNLCTRRTRVALHKNQGKRSIKGDQQNEEQVPQMAIESSFWTSHLCCFPYGGGGGFYGAIK